MMRPPLFYGGLTPPFALLGDSPMDGGEFMSKKIRARRLCSIILTVALLISYIPYPARAVESEGNVEDKINTDAIAVSYTHLRAHET